MATPLKLPPQNLEAEESVLGALLIDKDAIIKIADSLSPEDFYKPAHTKIYETILKLYESRQPIDILSLTTRLKETNALTESGGSTLFIFYCSGLSWRGADGRPWGSGAIARAGCYKQHGATIL